MIFCTYISEVSINTKIGDRLIPQQVKCFTLGTKFPSYHSTFIKIRLISSALVDLSSSYSWSTPTLFPPLQEWGQ